MHTEKGHNSGSGDTIKPSNVDMLSCFRSSANIEVDKEASRLMTQRIHNGFSDVLQELDISRVLSR